MGTGQDTELSEQTPALSSEGTGVPDLMVLEQGCGGQGWQQQGCEEAWGVLGTAPPMGRVIEV